AAGLVWLWFINLFNFMDGIDGMAGGEAVSLGLGLFLLSTFAALDPSIGDPALLAIAAGLGFLVWNWHPARIFLGDVGSVPLGFLFGWLLLGAAARGYWAPALILPLYYLADATLTLLRRLARGELVWRAHREHFYQCAVQRGLSHAEVVLAVLAANAGLVALALAAALGWTWPALAGAVLVVAALLWYLARPGRVRTSG
ncbi:MAG: MraY family glycosyltransferase, partial [Alphaproteobacteria bacterium]